jgi:molybdopterin-guanine dinucleotide biosynthesis protein A
MTADQPVPPTLGAILAGGLARRIGGGDKALRVIAGRSVLTRLVDRLAPQVDRVVLNANDNPRRFAAFGLPVVGDNLPDHPGPLAGVLAVLEWIAARDPRIEWVVTVPGDAPFLPRDLVRRLHAGRCHDNAALACAASQGRIHPIVAVWPVSLRHDLRRALVEDGVRKVDAFRQRYPCSVLQWPTEPVDPFFNINTPADLTAADHLASIHPEL